jgi:putative NADH-flavin reductase
MIALIGATGRTGGHVLALALEAGEHVRALVRDPSRLASSERLEAARGDPREPADVAALVAGVDVVICTIGQAGPTDAPQDTRTRVARALVAAAPPRVVMIGNAGVLPGDGGRLRGEGGPEEYRAVLEDHRGAWETLRDSELDWRLLCPPFIPDGPPTGTALTTVEAFPEGAGDRVTTGELARVALALAATSTPSRVRIGVAEVGTAH